MNFVLLNCSLFTSNFNTYSQYNIRCARNIKHCLLESLPALVDHNTLRGAHYMANCKFIEKSYGFIKHKILNINS